MTSLILAVENLAKNFPGKKGENAVVALDDVSLDLEPGKVLTLLGPSGCGKTTTLRCIAGLQEPDRGRITVGGQVMFDNTARVNIMPNKRGLGMVFQSYAIWPNMNVFQNVAFPLKVRSGKASLKKSEIRQRVERALTTVHLDHLMERPATDLSGGQQQRLALARALVMEPVLLLLDEPLSNLDVKLREEMLFELKRLQRELGITTVYVTHDQTEALAMSNQIAVMNHGKVEQIGSPREIYNDPKTRFVAGFVGKSNFISGTVVSKVKADLYEVKTADGSLLVQSGFDATPGKEVVVSLRNEHINLDVDPDVVEGLGVWKGKILGRAFLGEIVEHHVQLAASTIYVSCNATQSFPPGTEVNVRTDPQWVNLIPEV
jgi:iron(III) transport system ATP-binding protein